MQKGHNQPEEIVLGVPYYPNQNPYQNGIIPPDAVYGDPKGVPLRQTIFRDTPAPIICAYCASSGLSNVRYHYSIV